MFSFFVPGKPMGKERPRHTRTGVTYTPGKTKAYEEFVRTIFKDKYKASKPIDKGISVAVFIIAYFKQPKNLTKAKRELIAKDKLYPTVKPDNDNIAKIICDSLNGLAYADDNQITELKVCKRYAEVKEEGKVVVFITTFAEHPELFDMCKGFEV